MELHKTKTGAMKQFEGWARTYDRSILNLLMFRLAYRSMFKEVRKRAGKSSSPFRLLDISCGTGNFLAKCRDSNMDIEGTGLDMAHNMIDLARSKAAKAGKNGASPCFALGDSERLPFRAGYFDMVTCSNSFHHYPDQLQAIKEMRRVLKDGGALVLIDGHRDDPWGYLIFDVGVNGIEKNVRHCSRREFMRLLKAAGFRKITQQMTWICPPLLMTVGQA